MISDAQRNNESVTAADVAAYIESLGVSPAEDEGFKFGDCEAAVSGVLVCWITTVFWTILLWSWVWAVPR